MVSVQNLHFAYKKKVVLDGLTLFFRPGFIYGLLGRNGTGKSTLLRSLTGLLFPGKGNIRVFNAVPGKRRPSFLQQVFMVPEEIFLPDVSVEKYVQCNAPFYPGFSRPQFDGYMKELMVPTGQSLQQMSYGQKKKVLIGFALACNTELLLMDEPTNGLDIQSKSQFRKIMAGAAGENKCIIISTHQVKDLENLIDHVCVLEEGKIVFDQPMERIGAKLQCRISFDSEETRNALYSEPALKGDAVITANEDGEEGKLDLELLYKAIILNGEGIRAVFNEH